MRPSKTGFVTFTKLLQLLLAFASIIILVKGVLILTAAQSANERKFKSKDFVDMPVRVRKVKNVESETWPNVLEIEIENVSDKPIYFINAVLALPDDPAPNGISGILLQYGKLENLDIARIAGAEDEHLDPGKTTTLVIPNVYRKGLLAKQKKAPQNFKKLEFWFDTISFGDGTGFQLDQFVDSKKKKPAPEPPQRSTLKKKSIARLTISNSQRMRLRQTNSKDTMLHESCLETAAQGAAINIK
jgi:hypothetical protein